jgi:hypothetical protein
MTDDRDRDNNFSSEQLDLSKLVDPAEYGVLPNELSVQRPDQMALGIIQEIAHNAESMRCNYSEGRVQEAFDRLQSIMEAGAELMKGFAITYGVQSSPE